MNGVEAIQAAIAQLRGRDEVGRGLREMLSPLVAYDAQRGGDLVHTLLVYVQARGNITAAAEALFLHRNSMAYRLQRIEEVGGLTVRDAELQRLLLTALSLADTELLQELDPAMGRSSDEGERKK